MDLLDVARMATSRYLKNHPNMHHWREEMLSDACLGACQAAVGYRDDRGASLGTYAGRRATGEVLDGVRRRAPLTRTEHARGDTLDTLPAHRLPAASVEELAALAWAPHAPGCMEDVVADRDLIDRMLATCTERERIVLVATLLHGHTLADVGAVLGVSESLVCHLRLATIGRLRAQFADCWRDAA